MSYLYHVPCCLWPRTRQLHFVALLAVAVPCGQKSYPVARVQGRDNCTLSPCWHVAVRCPAVLTIIALLLLKLKNRITLQLLLAPCGANFATPLAYTLQSTLMCERMRSFHRPSSLTSTTIKRKPRDWGE